MFKRFTRLYFLIALLTIPTAVFSQINVTDSVTAAQMVQTLVGSGIVFSNPVLDCPETQSGLYSVVSSNLGLGDGVILTTGRAETDSANNQFGANGPQTDPLNPFNVVSNCNDLGNYPHGGDRYDSALNAVANIRTFDRCVLEFDFVPDGDSLLFEYVFGSEEYDGYSCTDFNDVFAFFLSGPGLVGTPNVALVPGTNIPVAINSTTNPAITMPWSLNDCQAMGPGSPFAQYYNDNSSGQSITYYGLTTVLTARAAVIPCTTYHIRLAIADGGDCALDSGVFLEANSFRSTSVKMSFNSSLSGTGADRNYLVEGCTSADIKVTRSTPFPIPQTVKLSYTGTATRNQDYSMVPDSVIIPANDTVASFTFSALSDVFVEGTEEITINIVNICTNEVVDSITFPIYDYLPYTFLSEDTAVCAGSGVRLQVEGDTAFNWMWTADPPGNIADPTSGFTWGYPDTTTTYTVTADFKSCHINSSSITVTVEPLPQVNILFEDTSLCLGEPLRLKANVGPDYFTNYTYTWAPNVGLSDPFIQEPDFFIEKAGTYKYILAAQTPLGCTGTDSVVIHARPAVTLSISGDVLAKYGDIVQLNADGAEVYAWTPTRLLDYPHTKDPRATAIDTALFRVIGMNQWGCRDTAYLKLDIDYSMHEIVPSAFSPNNDGRNDVFRVGNLKYQRLLEFRVFNRWGQEVFSTTDPAMGWDGTLKGMPQEVGVYQYLIRITTPEGIQRVYKGDVTLVR